MKKIKLFPIILIVCLLFATMAPSAFALEDPQLTADHVLIADMASGRILYSKDMETQTAPASLTKIMTLLIAVEAIENGEATAEDSVEAPADCRIGMDEESSTAGIVPGEVMKFGDVLYCAMLASANEACNIIATHLSGSIDAFVDRMNERAVELGCKNTHFSNTNGLTAADHLSTAYDFYLITKEAISHPMFMTMCNTISYIVPPTNVYGERELNNSNALISSKSIYGDAYLYEGAAGVKTGYTNAAGYCLISTAEKDGIQTVAVVMGSDGPNNSSNPEYCNFVDSIELYDWCFSNFSYKTFITALEAVTKAEIALAEGDGIAILRPTADLELLVANDVAPEDMQLNVTVYEDKLVAPIEAGTVLGEADVIIGGVNYGKIMLATNVNIDLSKSEYIKMRLEQTFDKTWVKVLIIAVLIFLVCYLLLVARYRRLRRKHLKARREAQQRRMEREAQYRAAAPTQAPEATQRFSTIDPAERYTGKIDLDDIFKDR